MGACLDSPQAQEQLCRLVDEMAAGHFELEQRIDQPKLAAAINQRLASGPIEPVDIDGNANAAGVVAAALTELEFVAKGL